MSTKTEATIEDLYRIDGKAEIVNGEIVHMSPPDDAPFTQREKSSSHCTNTKNAPSAATP